jgi:hypothetical protein
VVDSASQWSRSKKSRPSVRLAIPVGWAFFGGLGYCWGTIALCTIAGNVASDHGGGLDDCDLNDLSIFMLNFTGPL